jgi:hypothetical protein
VRCAHTPAQNCGKRPNRLGQSTGWPAIRSQLLNAVLRDLAAPHLVRKLWNHRYSGTPRAPWANGVMPGELLAFGTEPFCARARPSPRGTACARHVIPRQLQPEMNSRQIVVKCSLSSGGPVVPDGSVAGAVIPAQALCRRRAALAGRGGTGEDQSVPGRRRCAAAWLPSAAKGSTTRPRPRRQSGAGRTTHTSAQVGLVGRRGAPQHTGPPARAPRPRVVHGARFEPGSSAVNAVNNESSRSRALLLAGRLGRCGFTR